MMTPDTHQPDGDEHTFAFARVHKRALGVAVGLTTGFLLFIVTMGHVAVDQSQAELLGLLSQYFYGYSVSPTGALIGLAWGFFTGFVAGWFAAFAHNFATAVVVFALRTKAELAQTNDFLDHI